MHADRIRAEEDRVSVVDRQVAACAYRDGAQAIHVDVQERVGAQIFCDANDAFPGAAFFREPDVFRPDADDRSVVELRRLAFEDIHIRGTDEACHEHVVGLVVEFQRKPDQLYSPRITSIGADEVSSPRAVNLFGMPLARPLVGLAFESRF